MGERGPPPKPTALKLIAGNPGKRDLNYDEAVPAPLRDFTPPPEVAEDSLAAQFWARLVPDLAACGLARSVDWPVLCRYCLKLSRWIYLGREVRKVNEANPASKGTTYPITVREEVVSPDGKKTTIDRLKFVAEFPWAIEWRTLDRELRADERALGISPAARSRITVKTDRQRTDADLRRDFFARPKYGSPA